MSSTAAPKSVQGKHDAVNPEQTGTNWTGLIAKLLQPHTVEISTVRATLVSKALWVVSKRKVPAS